VSAAISLLVMAGLAAATAGREDRMKPTPSTPAAAQTALRLPLSLAGWTRPAAIRRVEPGAIFEYMDGAGELYLAYRFDHLEVVEYASNDQGEILVELYWMKSSDDAYGLLSGDWGGEPISLKGPPAAGRPRALYGAGLLRIWSDGLYARVLASHESEATRRAVLALGRAMVAGRSDPPAPRLVTGLPRTIAEGFVLRGDTVCFLRSHLVLNSAYFVSQQNILSLDRTVDAVTARYGRRSPDPARRPVRLMLVRYPDPEVARNALARFREAYLPETRSDPSAAISALARIEDGWAGYRMAGRGLAIVFEAPDREEAATFLAAGVQTLENLEAPDG
jgi:hypothetical protein